METTSPNSIKNDKITYLDPVTGKFAKGNPGGGKPKGTRHFATVIKEALKQKYTIKQPDGTFLKVKADDAMVMAMINAVIKKGDVRAFEAVTDRYEGKPHQAIEVEHTLPPTPILKLKARTGKVNLLPNSGNQ